MESGEWRVVSGQWSVVYDSLNRDASFRIERNEAKLLVRAAARTRR